MHQVVEQPALAAPAPPLNTDTEVFWAATAEGRLLFSRCEACGEAIWYPRPICPFCHGATYWEQASGRGRLYSFTIVRRGSGAFSNAAPYVLAYVELAEGPRMMTNIVDGDPATLAIGDELDVVFHRSESGAALPRFRPVVR